MVDGTDTYHYCFDANGNVGQLVSAYNGEVAAHYEFDPFGNIVSQNGSMADANPFRFSTKYQDAETNLYYYGYRYYSTELGRWINRDPLNEDGGANLYAFLYNDSINLWDLYGLNPLGDFIGGLSRGLDTALNRSVEILGLKDPDLAKRLQGNVQFYTEAGGLNDLNETLVAAYRVIYITQLAGQTTAGVYLFAGGPIGAAGGSMLIADAVDKYQALFTGEEKFREWVDSMPISEKEKKVILCTKEAAVIVVDIAALSAYQKSSRFYYNNALKKEGLSKLPSGQTRYQKAWSQNGYDIEVRVHKATYNRVDAEYRVAKRLQGVNSQGQGNGWQYIDKKGTPYKESILTERFRDGRPNPNFNAKAAADTHIQVPITLWGKLLNLLK